MDDRIEIQRAAITVTFRCTLKCKLCGVDAPRYDNPKHFATNDIKTMISRFLNMVDYVEEFELSGGEALMHEDLADIIEYAMNYKDKFGHLYIFTNGTIMPKEKVWETLRKYNTKSKFFISNYGRISAKVPQLREKLEEYQIDYKEKKYYGEDAHCGGWVDFGDFSLTKYNYKECYYLHSPFCIQIRNGEIHMCGRSYRAMELGIIEKNPEQYIDILKPDFDIESERKHFRKLINLEELDVCKYCNGLRPDSERFMPAEQL